MLLLCVEGVMLLYGFPFFICGAESDDKIYFLVSLAVFPQGFDVDDGDVVESRPCRVFQRKRYRPVGGGNP